MTTASPTTFEQRKPAVVLHAVVRPRRMVELTKLKRWPTLKRHLLGKRVRIFSAEWSMFWRENGNGYTPHQEDAWVTTFEHAWDVSHHAGPEKKLRYDVA